MSYTSFDRTSRTATVALITLFILLVVLVGAQFKMILKPKPSPEFTKESPIDFSVMNTYQHWPEFVNAGISTTLGFSFGAATADNRFYCSTSIVVDETSKTVTFQENGECRFKDGEHYSLTGIFSCNKEFCALTGVK